jgi:dimethylaniline monooxygenase (N-oxide forming)
LKNLREEGFHVTGFDRNEYVGGLWQYSQKEQTSVLETTTVNISKERACFTDFPFPEDVPSHPAAAQVQQYLIDYAKNFKLEPYMRLSTLVKQIKFDEERQKWVVDIEGGDKEYFDKVVVAIGGMVGKASLPIIEGIEKFAGPSIHSQAFKRPQDYEKKRVLVVGSAIVLRIQPRSWWEWQTKCTWRTGMERASYVQQYDLSLQSSRC